MTEVLITRELLREWEACYDDERIAELVPSSGLSPLEVAGLSIPVQDRMWVLLREEVLPARELRLLACRWARQALELVPAEQRDPRSVAAVEVAERYARGEATEAELAAASDAAWASSAATRSSASAAARASSAAAWVADWDAAWAAARASSAAAWVADWDAAWSARAAARAAALDDQLADVVGVLQSQ